MFTIKHITPYGNEALHEALEVTYSPFHTPKPFQLSPDAPPDHAKMGDLVAAIFYRSTNPTADLAELAGGTVYVMNETGATVAKYDLGGWAQPS